MVPFVKEAFGDIEKNQEGTGASPSRSPHHGHDPGPDSSGQAVPDGGQLGHLGRDRLGLQEAAQSLGLVCWRPSDAAAKEGRGANCFAFCFALPAVVTQVAVVTGGYGNRFKSHPIRFFGMASFQQQGSYSTFENPPLFPRAQTSPFEVWWPPRPARPRLDDRKGLVGRKTNQQLMSLCHLCGAPKSLGQRFIQSRIAFSDQGQLQNSLPRATNLDLVS